jgi:hypothetical protein
LTGWDDAGILIKFDAIVRAPSSRRPHKKIQECWAVVKGKGPARTRGSPSAVSIPRLWKGMRGQRQSPRLAEKNPQPRRSQRIADGGLRAKPKVPRRRGRPVQFSIVRYDMPNELCMSASNTRFRKCLPIMVPTLLYTVLPLSCLGT